jgi:hypothetical protein
MSESPAGRAGVWSASVGSCSLSIATRRTPHLAGFGPGERAETRAVARVPDVGEGLAEKLLIKPESRVLLLNAPIGYAKKLQPLPEGVTITDRRSQTASDVAIVFVRDTGELKRLQSGFASLEEDAALWVCYPEGGKRAGADIDQDTLRAAVESDELTEVSRVAFDEKWTCVQLRTQEDD